MLVGETETRHKPYGAGDIRQNIRLQQIHIDRLYSFLLLDTAVRLGMEEWQLCYLQKRMTKSVVPADDGHQIHRFVVGTPKGFVTFDAEADKRVKCHGWTLVMVGLAVKAAVLELRDKNLPIDEETEIWMKVRVAKPFACMAHSILSRLALAPNSMQPSCVPLCVKRVGDHDYTIFAARTEEIKKVGNCEPRWRHLLNMEACKRATPSEMVRLKRGAREGGGQPA